MGRSHGLIQGLGGWALGPGCSNSEVIRGQKQRLTHRQEELLGPEQVSNLGKPPCPAGKMGSEPTESLRLLPAVMICSRATAYGTDFWVSGQERDPCRARAREVGE